MKRIITALSSFGMSGKLFHAPFIFVHPGFQLYAVWERNEKRASGIYPGIVSYNSYEALLNDPAIDLVIINTPNVTHFEFARQALEAGKNVLVEKPFTVHYDEAEQLVMLAKKYNKKITVYQNRRFDSDFLTVKEILQEGVLGKIIDAEIKFDRFNPSLSIKKHKETGMEGTGIVHDLGAHIIDQALQLFGMPERIFADLRTTRASSKINDYMDVLFFYADKNVRLRSSFMVKEPLPAYILNGTNGSFLKSRSDVQEKQLADGGFPNVNDWGIEPKGAEGLLHIRKDLSDVRLHIPAVKGNYMNYYDLLYASLVHEKPLPVTDQEALSVMKLIDAIHKSSERKELITVQ